MSATTVAFVGALAYRSMALREVLAEHLADQDGEVLPHLFMADVERWAERTVASDATSDRQALEEVLAFLEDAYATRDEEIEELVSVSFLEHVPRPGQNGSELRSLLGPHLSQQLRRIG